MVILSIPVIIGLCIKAYRQPIFVAVFSVSYGPPADITPPKYRRSPVIRRKGNGQEQF
jgi:hypothetical protein